MYRSNTSRIVPMIIFIVVIVALIAGLITAGQYLFGGNNKQAEQTKSAVQSAKDELLTLTADRSIRLTVRGPIVADKNFSTYQVSVSPSSRAYTLYDGYLGNVKENKSFSNNMKAYEEFVYALDKANITKPGKYTEEQASDLRGICATGPVYEFEFLDGGSVKKSYWTSTCKGSPGTLGASVAQLMNLFAAQMPEVKLEGAGSSNQLSL
jgi:hypothetical protein